MGQPKYSTLSPEEAARRRAVLSEKKREAWKRGAYNNRQNGALQEEVQKRISESVKERWAGGAYDQRVNGMLGKFCSESPNWEWGKWQYREILKQHEAVTCSVCGAEPPDKIDAHHVDENRSSYLLSNLMWLCVPCHAWKFHYSHDQRNTKKKPFVTISKKFPFEYSHILPWHPGKCGQLHGHSGVITVKIRARLDPNGVVEDYYDIGAISKMAIVDKMDHRFLNDFLPNPTSEEFLVFAWHELEQAGLKGMTELEFCETVNTTATLTKADMLEAYGWDMVKVDGIDKWKFMPKPSEATHG